jgi:hypothetical protein
MTRESISKSVKIETNHSIMKLASEGEIIKTMETEAVVEIQIPHFSLHSGIIAYMGSNGAWRQVFRLYN